MITSRKSEERKRTTNLDDGEPTIEAHQCEEVYGGVHADVCETAVDLWVYLDVGACMWVYVGVGW